MSSDTDRNGPEHKNSDDASGKPAASLLTIPLFKASRSRHAGRISSDAPPSPPRTAKPESQAEEPARVHALHGASPAPPAETGIVPQTQRSPEPPLKPATPPEKPVAVESKHLRQYWRRVASGGVPAIEELDNRTIARNWPYTLLIRVPDDALVDIVHVYAPEPGANRNGDAEGAHPLAQDHYSQLSAWLLRLARETAPTRAPRETTESFPMAGGLRSFTAQAMPCQSRNDAAAYVLLNISRA